MEPPPFGREIDGNGDVAPVAELEACPELDWPGSVVFEAGRMSTGAAPWWAPEWGAIVTYVQKSWSGIGVRVVFEFRKVVGSGMVYRSQIVEYSHWIIGLNDEGELQGDSARLGSLSMRFSPVKCCKTWVSIGASLSSRFCQHSVERTPAEAEHISIGQLPSCCSRTAVSFD
jgi:hypothetical protein